MKCLSITLLLSVSAGLFAQKIKVKKGEIFDNKTKIGTISSYRSDNGKLVMTISDLKGL